MKKIIAAFDGLKFSESTCDYASYLTKLANAHLTGVFLDDMTYSSYNAFELVAREGVSEKKLKRYEQKDRFIRDKSVRYFENICKKSGLEYNIHRDRYIASQELLHESIYTDLLVIDSKETLTHYDEKIPTRFIRDLLTHVQCPVFLVPQKYKPVEKIVLLYDGEPSSVYAMKMFGYMFPFMGQVNTEIITVKDIGQNRHLPDSKLMKEFMKRHYPKAVFKVLKGLPEIEILQYLKAQSPNMLVVLGAYRRGMVSRWFRTSMADVLMKEVKAPLFIAHYKS